MLKIGEFSKIAQVSVKTLRYYDRMGLLKPAHIDRYSGYRYYSLEQLMRLNRILALKDLDFTLEQISELLQGGVSSEVVQAMLANKAKELRDRISDENARLLRVQNRLKSIQEPSLQTQSPVVLKSAADQRVATIRQVLPKMDQLPEWQEAKRDEIHRFLERWGQNDEGPDILIYHQEEYRETDLDVEVGTILCTTRHKDDLLRATEHIQVYTLPRVDHLATCVTTKAGYLSETYAHLTHWTQINGFRPIAPWRELTFSQEDPAAPRVIEVQRPVMEAITFYKPLEVNKMEPKIIKKPAFTIVGLPYFGKNENQEIHELWNQFNRRMAQIGEVKNDTGEACIGLCITRDDNPLGGAFEYIAGLPVSQVEDLPENFVVRQVPEHTYAVFSHQGDLQSLGKTYEYIYATWLPQSGYELAEKLDFEYYNEDFKDFAPDSVFYIYIPIK